MLSPISKMRRKIIMSGTVPERMMVRRPRAKPDDVLALIKKLRPLDCGMDLIRIGPAADGGYLIPDDLEGIEYCFSPGVSVTSGFEDALADRGVKSFLADYSIESPTITRPEFIFDKKFLGATDHGKFFTLGTWKDKYLKGYTGELILQMDIEGFEYQVVANAPDALLDQFRIMVVEFHALDRIFDRFIFTQIVSCMEKLLQYFYVAHIHPNNCCGSIGNGTVRVPSIMEFTFINKRRASQIKPRGVFPHPLDADNLNTKPPLPLPKCWYRDL